MEGQSRMPPSKTLKQLEEDVENAKLAVHIIKIQLQYLEERDEQLTPKQQEQMQILRKEQIDAYVQLKKKTTLMDEGRMEEIRQQRHDQLYEDTIKKIVEKYEKFVKKNKTCWRRRTKMFYENDSLDDVVSRIAKLIFCWVKKQPDISLHRKNLLTICINLLYTYPELLQVNNRENDVTKNKVTEFLENHGFDSVKYIADVDMLKRLETYYEGRFV